MKPAAPEISGSHLAIRKGSQFLERCEETRPLMPLERCWIKPALNWAFFETLQLHEPMSSLYSFCQFVLGFLLLGVKCLLIPS